MKNEIFKLESISMNYLIASFKTLNEAIEKAKFLVNVTLEFDFDDLIIKHEQDNIIINKWKGKEIFG